MTTAVALRPQDIEGFDKLTYREQQFVLHPETLNNPVAAALAVGFAPQTARSKSHAMRKRLQKFIAPQRLAIMQAAQVSLEEVARRLAAIARANPDEYQERIEVEVAEGYETMVVYKDPSDLTEDQRLAIMRIDYEVVTLPSGVMYQMDRPTNIELYPKDKALKELREMFPKVVPDDPNKAQAELFDHMDPEDFAIINRIYARAELRRANNLKPVIEAPHVEPKTPDSRPSAEANQGERERRRPPVGDPARDVAGPGQGRRREPDRPVSRNPVPAVPSQRSAPVDVAKALGPVRSTVSGGDDDEGGDGLYREF